MTLTDSPAPNSHRARPWLVVAVLAILGISDLLFRGPHSDARLLLLVCVVALALHKGWRSGVVALIVSTIGLLIAALVENSSLPLSGHVPQSPLGTLLLGLGVFVISGGLVVWYVRAFNRRTGNETDEAQPETRPPADPVADAQVVALQATNQSLQRRSYYLAASLSVAQSLSTIFDGRALVNRAAETIKEQFGFQDVLIFTVDDTEEWATLQAAATVAGKEIAFRGLRLRRDSGGPIGWVIARKQPKILSRDERQEIESRYVDDLDSVEIQSSATLPLMVGQQLVGILDIHSVMDESSVADDLDSLEGLATYLALAINNARRFSNEATLLEATSPIYRTANDLAIARTEREVYDVFLSASRLYGPSQVLVVLSSDVTSDPHVVAEMQHADVNYVPRDLVSLTPSSLIDAVILVLALDAPLWVRDLSNLDESLSPELGSALAALKSSEVAQALAFVPIRMEASASQGGLLLLYRTTHRFAPVERRLHALLTELGGAALDRSRLLTEARARLDREEVLLSVGERLRSSLDPDVIMGWFVQELGRALDTEFVTIEISPPSVEGRRVQDDRTTPQRFDDGVTVLRTDNGGLVLLLGSAESRLGVVKIQPHPGHELTSDQVALAQAIAAEAGSALARARLFGNAQDALVEVGMLQRSSRAILDAETPQAILRAIADNVAAPELDRLLLILPETSTVNGQARMQVVAVLDTGPSASDLLGRVWSETALPILGKNADAHYVLDDVAADESLDEASRQILLGEMGIVSALPAPLSAGHHVVGWLVLGATDQLHTFTPREQRLYGGMADLAAAVVRNFQVLDLATDRAERAQALGTISSRMRETLDMDLILQTALHEIGESLGLANIEVRMRGDTH